VLSAPAFPRFGAALSAVGLAAAVVSACSFDAHTGGGLSLSKTDLEKALSDKLAKAGQIPQTVTCQNNLQGEVGKSTRCSVLLSGATSFDLVVTATKIDGENISYTSVPALSKEQLEKSVATTVSKNATLTVDSVDCENGLEGQQGAQAHCEVAANGSTQRMLATVTKIEGLMLYYHVQPAP